MIRSVKFLTKTYSKPVHIGPREAWRDTSTERNVIGLVGRAAFPRSLLSCSGREQQDPTGTETLGQRRAERSPLHTF